MTRYGRFCTAVIVGAAAAFGGGFALVRHKQSPLDQAKALVAEGHLRSALLVLRSAVRDQPRSAAAHQQLATVQLELSTPIAAEAEARTALRLGGDRWAILPLLGEALLAEDKDAEVPVQLPEEGPTPAITARLLMWRGLAQLALNDVPGAGATLAVAQREAPNQVETVLLAARLAIAGKDLAGAERWVDAALALDPRQPDALVLHAQLLSARGEPKAALAASDRAVAAAPWSPRARLDRANLLMTQGRDKEAEQDVTFVLSNFPSSAEAIYLDGVLLARRGDYAGATTTLEHLNPVIDRYPRTLYFQSMLATQLGHAETAVEYAKRYVQRVPDELDGALLLARAELAAGHAEQAVATLKTAVDAGHRDGTTLDLLGQAYSQAGQVDEAVRTFQQAAAAAPGNAEVKVHLALTKLRAEQSKAVIDALGEGKPAVAEAALAKLRHLMGDTEAVAILEGSIRMATLDYEGARTVFAAAVKANPGSAPARLALAEALARQGKTEDALGLLQDTLTLDPANAPALTAFVQLAMREHLYDRAIGAVQKANASTPQARGFLTLLSDVLVQAGQAHQAIDLLLGARNRQGLTAATQGALARAQLAAGLPDEAKQTLRTLLDAVPDDLPARREQVGLLLHDNKLEAARDSLEAAEAAVPGDLNVMATLVRVVTRLDGEAAGMKRAAALAAVPANMPGAAALPGEVLMQAGKPAEAAEAYLAAYRRDPSSTVLMRLAAAHMAAGQDGAAAGVLTAWLRTHPGDTAAVALLAQLDLKAGRFDDASARLQLVVARRPGDALAMNNLAWLFMQKGDKRALALAQEAFRLAPTPSTGDTLGWVMVKAGDAKEAVPLLRKASGQRPEDAGIAYHLAVALKQSGQAGEAVDVLKVLVARKGDFPDRASAQTMLEGLSPGH